MTWKPVTEYEEVIPVRARSTRKKVWNTTTKEWKDVTLWTVESTKELCDWLQKEYPKFAGWGFTWSDSKITMEEPVYLHYCLARPG
jgi:hypothetical protein